MNLRQQPTSAPVTTSQGPSSILRGSPESRFNNSLSRALVQENINFSSEQIREAFDASVRNTYRELHRSLDSQIRREVLAEEIQGASLSNRNEEINSRLEARLEEKVTLLARAISNVLAGTSQVQDRMTRSSTVIDNSTIYRVTTLVAGLGFTIHNEEFSNLVHSISQNPETLDSTSLEEVFNRISTMNATSNLAAMRTVAAQFRNQSQQASSLQSDPSVFSLTTLQALSNTQQRQLGQYAVYQIGQSPEAAAKAETVLKELVTTGSLPIAILQDLILNASVDSNNPSVYTDMYSRILAYQLESRREAGAVQQELGEAIRMATSGGVDITNPALRGSTWAKFFGYVYGLFAASVNLGTGILSGDVSGGIASALPWAGLSAVTFQNEPLDSFGRLSRRLAYSKGGREQMSENQRRQVLSNLTLHHSPETISLFASQTFIDTLMSSVNLENPNAPLDLSQFEQNLRDRNPDIYDLYHNNYASQFRTSRGQPQQNLVEIAYAYQHLGIVDYGTFLDRVAIQNGITENMLTDLDNE